MFTSTALTHSWEQRKLSEIADKVTEKNKDLVCDETFTNSAEHGIISQIDFFDKEISNKESIAGYYIVKEDDFIYNPRISNLAPYGPINRNKLGRVGIMSPLYTVFSIKNVNPLFLEWYYKSNSWHKYMYENGDTGARADRLAIKDDVFFNMPMLIPNIEEQEAIGNTLEKINNVITLHQCKFLQYINLLIHSINSYCQKSISDL